MLGLENPTHILLVLVVVFLVFGAKRLPEMGRGLGSGIRGFKDGLTSQSDPTSLSMDASTPESAEVQSS
jgi:sec-independent protein translocase protein TatA